MRFRNVSHLSKLEHGALYAFMAQRLNELTFDYSLDSHKAPSVSLPSLITEALDQVYAVRDAGNAISDSSVNPILEELTKRLAGNLVVSELLPSNRDALERLRGSLEVAKNTLEILANELNPLSYTSAAMKLILQAIESDSKSDLDFLLREMVSNLENMGMSRAHIFFSSQRFFYEKKSNITELDDIRKFLEIIFPHHHDFTIALKITSFGKAIDEEHFNAFGLEIKHDVRDDFENLDPANPVFDIEDGQVFLLCEDIEAYDRFSAIERAVEKASLLQNLFRLYHHAEKLQIEDRVVVSQCCIDEVAVCNRQTNKMLNVEDERPKKAGYRLKDLVTKSKLLRGGDASRFISLSEFHGMGIDASTVENQIINLWISLETISPSRVGHSKISNVISAMLPVMALGYTHRLVRRAAVDLLTWSRFRTSRCLKGVEPAVDAPFGRLLSVLTIPEYNDNLSKLFEELEDFELLRYRLFRMYEVFSDPKKLLRYISEHQTRVDWQIRRIYRARNSIVHRGDKPPFANQIVDNAHEYLDQAITLTVAVSSGLNGMTDYEECFNLLSWEYEKYISRLEGLDRFELGNANMAIWQRAKTVTRDEVLWLR